MRLPGGLGQLVAHAPSDAEILELRPQTGHPTRRYDIVRRALPTSPIFEHAGKCGGCAAWYAPGRLGSSVSSDRCLLSRGGLGSLPGGMVCPSPGSARRDRGSATLHHVVAEDVLTAADRVRLCRAPGTCTAGTGPANLPAVLPIWRSHARVRRTGPAPTANTRPEGRPTFTQIRPFGPIRQRTRPTLLTLIPGKVLLLCALSRRLWPASLARPSSWP